MFKHHNILLSNMKVMSPVRMVIGLTPDINKNCLTAWTVTTIGNCHNFFTYILDRFFSIVHNCYLKVSDDNKYNCNNQICSAPCLFLNVIIIFYKKLWLENVMLVIWDKMRILYYLWVGKKCILEDHATEKTTVISFFFLTWCDFYSIIFRSASPRHGFTIMNRLSMENRTEPITKDLDFQLQDPFLLYRNARCKYVICWVKCWRGELFLSVYS